MNKTSILSIGAILVLVIGTGFFLRQALIHVPQQSQTSIVATSTLPEAAVIHKNLRNISVIANDHIESPLTLTGEAKLWYFEGSFPVELVDAEGTQLAIAPAQAQGDWMNSEFVPFRVTLQFSQPTTTTGMLIFHKDNPSGLPEYDDSFSIPVRFN